MTLHEILIKYFGSGFKYEESATCDSYKKLIDLIYDLSKLGVVNSSTANDIVDFLDEIASENGLFDEEGFLILDDEKIKEIIEERLNNE